MKALCFDGQLALREVATPRPGPDEALVKVRLAGICGTDREILKGYSAFRGVMGHEFVGQVVECRSGDWQDKRVVGEINVSCGECDYCLWGLGRHCPRRTVMGIANRDGALAEYVVLPVVNLHEVPEEISDPAAVFTEPLAAAAEILEQLESVPTRRALVLGDGRLGLLVAQVLSTAGVRITVAGRHAEKLQLARSWGMNVADVQKEPLPSAGFALVVEATGSPAGLTEALRLVEPRGTVVMKSTFQDRASFDTAKLVVDEINLLGSRCGNFSTALDLLRHGRIRVREMISKTFPLEAGLQAFEYLSQPSCLKVLLKPSTDTPR
jgi:2-desacetyl-2-hydroxyethyl bacteriochlorophyllide A dehydrogenase